MANHRCLVKSTHHISHLHIPAAMQDFQTGVLTGYIKQRRIDIIDLTEIFQDF